MGTQVSEQAGRLLHNIRDPVNWTTADDQTTAGGGDAAVTLI